ncbi:MAG: RluA family pseudouridine synthase [Spirochaetales bacterium]|nr:RluA family pseudouridine synthase [Spirochaetales bacterium]
MNSEKYASFTAGSNDNGRRADRIIRQFIPERSLGGVYKAFRKGLIRINGKKVSPDSKLMEGDSLEIYRTLLEERPSPDEPLEPHRAEKLDILYEDDDLLALSKSRGTLVHGGEDSLEKEVSLYLKDKLPPSLVFKPGPLHRLDRNTSGLIYFSKSLSGARDFSENLRGGKFRKYYAALLDGTLKRKAVWVDNLQRDGDRKVSFAGKNGETARSTCFPLRSEGNRTLAVILIETGRTHQIRVQASHHGHPLSGDRKYGGSPLEEGYLLHSLKIETEAGSALYGKELPEAPLPQQWKKTLGKLFTSVTLEQLMNEIHGFLEDQ